MISRWPGRPAQKPIFQQQHQQQQGSYTNFKARQATDQYCDDLKIQNHGISTILNATATVTSTSTKRYLGRGGGGEEMEDEQNLR